MHVTRGCFHDPTTEFTEPAGSLTAYPPQFKLVVVLADGERVVLGERTMGAEEKEMDGTTSEGNAKRETSTKSPKTGSNFLDIFVIQRHGNKYRYFYVCHHFPFSESKI